MNAIYFSKIDHLDAWKTMMWFLIGKRPFIIGTKSESCETENHFKGYKLLQKVNLKNKTEIPLHEN